MTAAHEPFPLDRFRQVRFGAGLRCPRCAHRRVHRWGRFADRKRYRCLGCGRTFSDFTGTPLAYLKHLRLWAAFCRLSPATPTVRRVARELGIHVSTSFRWRHRLLAGLLTDESAELCGDVNIGIDWLASSEKGSRRLLRPPRRRRFEGFTWETEPIWIAIACDEDRRAYARSIGPQQPVAAAVVRLLRGRVRPNATLLARAHHRALVRKVALALQVGLGDEITGLNAWQSHRHGPEPPRLWFVRFRRWLRRFRGIASRYLDHYLAWFRRLDPSGAGCGQADDLPWAAA